MRHPVVTHRHIPNRPLLGTPLLLTAHVRARCARLLASHRDRARAVVRNNGWPRPERVRVRAGACSIKTAPRNQGMLTVRLMYRSPCCTPSSVLMSC